MHFCGISNIFKKLIMKLHILVGSRLVPNHKLVNNAVAGANSFSLCIYTRLCKFAVEECTTISTFGSYMMHHALSMLHF